MSYVDTWDSGTTGADWDSGLQWDAISNPRGDVQPYLDIITSEHREKSKFMAMVRQMCQPYADLQFSLSSLVGLFDLDVAVGQQLDFIGQWVGQSRNIATIIANAYFSWDIPGLGWNQGFWRGPGDSDVGIITLPDEPYRLLLRTRIGANQWNGTLIGAYAAYDLAFADQTFNIDIVDNTDMTMDLVMTNGTAQNVVVQQLFTGGYFDLRPAGVEIASRTMT